MNIANALKDSAERQPDHPAVEDGTQTISFRVFDDHADAMAAGLQRAGVKPADLVGLMLVDSIDHLALIFGIARLGARMISFVPGMPVPEIAATLGSLDLRLAITQDGDRHLGDVETLSLEALGSLASKPPVAVAPGDVGDRDLFIYEQSSGTTGVPKLIPANHEQYDWWGQLHVKHLGWRPEDRYFALISLHFAFGRLLAATALRHGLTVVLQSGETLQQVVELMQRERITLVYLTPAHLRAFLGVAPRSQPLFPDLRRMVCSTSPLSPHERNQARDQLTPNFFETFGTNETGTLAVATPSDHITAPETVGKIIESVDAEVIDAKGRRVAPGEVGLIRFRNPALPDAYPGNPKATARHFRDGWFYPGDLASVDEDGRLFLKGRADDVIDNQGAKFYPVEIENALLAHPRVAEAAVIGWPRGSRGTIPVGFVVPKDGAITSEELVEFCLTRLSRHKVPRRFLIMKALPRNPMGKVVKERLAAFFRKHEHDTDAQRS